MATFNRFNQFAQDLLKGVHNFDAHTFKVMLTNTLPVNTNAVKADITEISAGNGYTAGGTATTVSTSIASNVGKVTASDVTFTASGGSIGPFRYAVLYNDTPTSPADPLVGWWDRGAATTLLDGDTLTWDADATAGVFTLTVS